MKQQALDMMYTNTPTLVARTERLAVNVKSFYRSMLLTLHLAVTTYELSAVAVTMKCRRCVKLYEQSSVCLQRVITVLFVRRMKSK